MHDAAAMLVRADLVAERDTGVKDELRELSLLLGVRQVLISWLIRSLERI